MSGYGQQTITNEIEAGERRGDKRRMAKVNLKDATKELAEGASEILERATRIRKEADSL